MVTGVPAFFFHLGANTAGNLLQGCAVTRGEDNHEFVPALVFAAVDGDKAAFHRVR